MLSTLFCCFQTLAEMFYFSLQLHCLKINSRDNKNIFSVREKFILYKLQNIGNSLVFWLFRIMKWLLIREMQMQPALMNSRLTYKKPFKLSVWTRESTLPWI